MSDRLDAVDARILDLIQHDAALSVAEIADRVGLSSSPCWRRIKRMEEDGVIQRRVTLLDREKLGLDFEVYCTVKLSLPTRENLDIFEQSVRRWDEVAQCATVTGSAMLKGSRSQEVARIIGAKSPSPWHNRSAGAVPSFRL